MKREEYKQIEESYKYATPILICCFIIAIAVVYCFINFLCAK